MCIRDRIEPDHVGHILVDDLVIGHAGADGIGETDVAGAVGFDESGHAEDGILAEDFRVEEVVVEAAVDGIDLFQACLLYTS